MANFETLEVHAEAEILRVTINRPTVLNALNEQVLSELKTLFTEALPASKPRVCVIQSAGDKAFVAGADISAMVNMDCQAAFNFSRLGHEVTTLMEQAGTLFIAKVQGFALGGGCELAMACDLIVASNKAKFGQPEVNLGLIPGFGGTQRLVERVGLPVALDMLCAGKILTGEEAYKLGLVSRVVAPESLDSEVNLMVRGILKGAPLAIAATKRLARRAREMALEAGLAAEASAFANCFGGAESKEGLPAFLEKRSASFAR